MSSVGIEDEENFVAVESAPAKFVFLLDNDEVETDIRAAE